MKTEMNLFIIIVIISVGYYLYNSRSKQITIEDIIDCEGDSTCDVDGLELEPEPESIEILNRSNIGIEPVLENSNEHDDSPDRQQVKPITEYESHFQTKPFDVPCDKSVLNHLDTNFLPVEGSGFSPDNLDTGEDSNLKAEDLLPSTDNEWSKMNDLVSNDMKNKNFLFTRNLGINTVGSSLRNACYDLRGVPPNPRLDNLPFMNSTIEHDNNMKHMEFVKYDTNKNCE